MSEESSAPRTPPDAAADEPVVSAAVPSPPEVEAERSSRADEEAPIEDPELLRAALQQELAGDGGAAAKRWVIAIGVVVVGCVVAMIIHVWRSAPTFDDTTSGTSSARQRQSPSGGPAHAPIRKRPTRPRSTTVPTAPPASASAPP